MFVILHVWQIVEVNDIVMSVFATTIQILAQDVNGSSNHYHSTPPSSNASASLIFPSSIEISGQSPIFLPEYKVAVNISANFSRIRVFLSAAITSPSLSFVSKNNSYIDLSPKCVMGEFVNSSYSCDKCRAGTYSNQVDSLTCRSESPTHTLLITNFHYCSQFFMLTRLLHTVFVRLVTTQTRRQLAASHAWQIFTSPTSKKPCAGPVRRIFSALSDAKLALPLISISHPL